MFSQKINDETPRIIKWKKKKNFNIVCQDAKAPPKIAIFHIFVISGILCRKCPEIFLFTFPDRVSAITQNLRRNI